MKAPASFDVATCRLICQKCGQVIRTNLYSDWANGSWLELEDRAQWAHSRNVHTCTTADELERAREAMKQYRAENPGLSFEEECRVYNEIMRNQTYLSPQ